jgi:hypothetical protein
VFDPSALRHAPWSFLWREFDFAAAADAAVATVFPFRRVDPIARLDVDTWLYWHLRDTLPFDPVAIRVLFHLPSFNLTQDWIMAPVHRRPDAAPPLAYPELPRVLRELTDICAARGVALLFLHQEASPEVLPDVLPMVEAACAAAPRTRVVDLHAHWRSDRFLDSVHPIDDERAAYAHRHHDAILRALRELAPTAPRSGR